MRIRDASTIGKKFVQRASAAGGDYKSGVEASGSDWQGNTAAAADNYAAGVQQAIGDGRFAAGVAKAGSAKFVQRASTLGAQRYPTGVAASEAEFVKGIGPVLSTLQSLSLPPRRPKGDPGNMERANAVARALRAQKVGK